MGKIIISDTTLRDGHQQPGLAFNSETRLEIARRLQDLGVDIIEAGFPANKSDFGPVYSIAQYIGTGTIVSALARVVKDDIDRAYEALQPAIAKGNAMIHVFIGTSDQLRTDSVRKSKTELEDIVGKQVRYAAERFPIVQFSPEDATRTDPQFLRTIVEIAISAGATIINIPDTVGYAQPKEYGEIIRSLMNIPLIKNGTVRVSTHCHNDLGLATANSLAGIIEGARQIEGTILGLGERAGNAHWAEIYANLAIRNQFFRDETGKEIYVDLNSHLMKEAAEYTARAAHMQMPRNFPIVGTNAARHSSGIHANAVMRNPGTYQIMNPAVFGQEIELVFGATSGRALTQHFLEQFGYAIEGPHVDELTEQMKTYAIQVEDSLATTEVELHFKRYFGEIAQDDLIANPRMQMTTGNVFVPYATMKVNVNGVERTGASDGVGVFDATVRSLLQALNQGWADKITFAGWEEFPAQQGQEAEAYARVFMHYDQHTYVGRARNKDIAVAAAMAAVQAINTIYSLNTPKNIQD